MADAKRSVLLPQPFAALSSNALISRGRRKAASLMSPETLKVMAALEGDGPVTPALAPALMQSPRLASPPPSMSTKFTPRRRTRLTSSARLPPTDTSSPKRSPLTAGWKGSTRLPGTPLSALPCRFEDSPRPRSRGDKTTRRGGRRGHAGLSLLVLLVLGSASVATLLAVLLPHVRPARELPMTPPTSMPRARRAREEWATVRAEPQPMLQLPAPPALSCRWQWKALRCTPSSACRLSWAWPPCKPRSASRS